MLKIEIREKAEDVLIIVSASNDSKSRRLFRRSFKNLDEVQTFLPIITAALDSLRVNYTIEVKRLSDILFDLLK